MARGRRRGLQRGISLIELMVAMALMLIATVGFVGAIREALNATAVGHRRTETTLLRTGLMERLSVARKSTIDAAAGAGWMVESCFDGDTNWKATNTGNATGFTCPDGTVYVRHLSVTAVPDAAGGDQRVWSVAVYVDRAESGCTPETRYASPVCAAADLFLTD
jgi:prepilin-type N-terminal cleavage/methylation domain-containing protein